jgi:hypothetical protein
MSAFHRLSEDLFVFPAARALPHGAAACGHCEAEHLSEAESLTALGRLLADLQSCARRGASQVRDTQLLHVRLRCALYQAQREQLAARGTLELP